jgi:hypothetical protein
VKNTQTVLNLVLAVVQTIVAAAIVWLFTTVVDLKADVAAIQGNRFTAADGLQIWQEIALVRGDIAKVREDMAKLPQEAPPVWFLQRVDKIEDDIAELRYLIVERKPE